MSSPLMTGLSEREVKHVIELLELLSEQELKELASTSTSGFISCRDKQESIKTIVQHSKDARSLLNRKKITKTTLFNYLHIKGISVVSGNDKNSLVEAILSFWGQQTSLTSVSPSLFTPPVDELTEELAVQFASWFYERLNEPAIRTGNDTLILTDFWNDAQTVVRLVPESRDPTGDSEEMSAGSDSESIALFDNLYRQHGLIYSPNLTGAGVRGRSDPHGAVMLIACGTLHRSQNQCVGVFEQTFLIIKDPVSQNWKIKKTLLILRSKFNVESVPILQLTDVNFL